MDSGGFTELSKYGRWTVSPKEYAAEARRAVEEIGRMDWAAPQDWMCEHWILEKTGKTVEEHQRLTTENYIELCSIEPAVNWIPVLQGWEGDDYLRHVEAYQRAGIDLEVCDTVGAGTMCRRQGMVEAERILRTLSGMGIKLHGFGFKKTGIDACRDVLKSSDSMAWSYRARYDKPLPGHTHKNCANCIEYAMLWRGQVINCGSVPHQLPFAF